MSTINDNEKQFEYPIRENEFNVQNLFYLIGDEINGNKNEKEIVVEYYSKLSKIYKIKLDLLLNFWAKIGYLDMAIESLRFSLVSLEEYRSTSKPQVFLLIEMTIRNLIGELEKYWEESYFGYELELFDNPKAKSKISANTIILFGHLLKKHGFTKPDIINIQLAKGINTLTGYSYTNIKNNLSDDKIRDDVRTKEAKVELRELLRNILNDLDKVE